LKWRICLAGIVWVVAGTILWGRIRQPGFTDTDIASAMAHGRKLFQAGDYREALACFWAIDIPDSFPYRKAQKYHNIGLIQYKLGNKKQAEAALRRAVSYDGEDFDAHYLLIRIACESKDLDKGREYLRKAKANAGPAGLPEQFDPLITKLEGMFKRD